MADIFLIYRPVLRGKTCIAGIGGLRCIVRGWLVSWETRLMLNLSSKIFPISAFFIQSNEHSPNGLSH